jgi:hypothetical protein
MTAETEVVFSRPVRSTLATLHGFRLQIVRQRVRVIVRLFVLQLCRFFLVFRFRCLDLGLRFGQFFLRDLISAGHRQTLTCNQTILLTMDILLWGFSFDLDHVVFAIRQNLFGLLNDLADLISFNFFIGTL